MSEVSLGSSFAGAAKVISDMASNSQDVLVAHFNAQLEGGVIWTYTGLAKVDEDGDTRYQTGGQNGNDANVWLISHGPQGESLLRLRYANDRDIVH